MDRLSLKLRGYSPFRQKSSQGRKDEKSNSGRYKVNKFKLGFFVSLISLLIVVISGCAAPQPKYMKLVMFDVPEAKQTQQGITIEVQPIDLRKEYAKPKYIGTFRLTYTPFLSANVVTEDIERLVGLYYQLLPLQVTITNKTEHILRMKDSRVVYIDPSSDEPVMAMDFRSSIDELEELPVFNHIYTEYKKKYKPKNDLDASILKALRKIAKKVKFVNAFNREIMPDMKYTGLVVFPVDPAEASEGKISFIDMVSQTDSAGNPVKRVRFDYRVKPLTKYYRYNPATDKDWVEISESESKGHI